MRRHAVVLCGFVCACSRHESAPDAPSPITTTIPSVATQPSATPSASTAAAAVDTGPPVRITIDASTRDKLADPASAEFDRLRVATIDGEGPGYRFFGIREKDTLATMGLQNGDGVTSVCDRTPASVQALRAAIARIGVAGPCTVHLVRRGTPMTLEWALK